MYMIRLFTLKCLLFMIFICFSFTSKANKKITEQYISMYKNIAIVEMRRTGIPASIKIAQGMLESDLGRSPLAFEANNHFGIKCGKDWYGDIYYKHDDDTDSTGAVIESCFRAYKNAEASYMAHSDFLLNPSKKSRYGFLFELNTTDYTGWANGLKFSGYATDPSYPQKLIKLIETYQLYNYDEPIHHAKRNDEVIIVQNTDNNRKSETSASAPNNSRPTETVAHKKNTTTIGTTSTTIPEKRTARYVVTKMNEVPFVLATGGESIKVLANKTGKDVFEILEYNEEISSQDQLLKINDIIYLAKKKKTFNDPAKAYHVVSGEESMYDISQKYGIRLESLLAKNNLLPGALPQKGEKISLHKNVSKKDTPKHSYQEKFDSYVDLGGLK